MPLEDPSLFAIDMLDGIDGIDGTKQYSEAAEDIDDVARSCSGREEGRLDD